MVGAAGRCACTEGMPQFGAHGTLVGSCGNDGTIPPRSPGVPLKAVRGRGQSDDGSMSAAGDVFMHCPRQKDQPMSDPRAVPPAVPRPNHCLRDVIAPACYRHRVVIDAARRWSLAMVCWLPSDLVALTLAVHAAPSTSFSLGDPSDEIGLGMHLWTRQDVAWVLTGGVEQWCARHHTAVPVRFPEAVWRFLDFLVATDRLDPASDPLLELRRPLRCIAELNASGHWRVGDDPDPGPCVCAEPYVGPTHGEVVRRDPW